MNTSGPAVALAFRNWRREPGNAAGKLVVLHDEMEEPLGRVRVRLGKASARGHNGVRSCGEVLGGQGVEFVRVGVGVGRCAGRGKEEVSAFLLRKMTGVERGRVEGAVLALVGLLRGIAAEGEGGEGFGRG